jgi:GntR family transcriptional regulator/MocR family aminotransferase
VVRSDLTLTIAGINAWNRLSIAARLTPGTYQVTVAHERLAAEGVIVGRVGAGTFVSADALSQTLSRSAPAGAGVSPRSVWQSIVLPAGAPGSPPPYDFAVGVPDARLFPLTSWRRLVARELRPAAVRGANYADPAGPEPLRAAIARYVGIARSVRAGTDDVLVTQGAQQALDLIGRVLIDPGTTVAVEEPGYPPARELFQSLGARVVGVPVDDEGIDVSAYSRVSNRDRRCLGGVLYRARRPSRCCIERPDPAGAARARGARPMSPLRGIP